MKILLPLLLALSVSLPVAAQVSVKGYTRKDGTYVAPHVRSSPDSSKANNYGPSSTSPLYTGKGSVTPPSTRDADRDGLPNYRDRDDDNDGRGDDSDKSQYGSRRY